MSDYKYNLRSRKHLDYATIHAGKSVHFPAYGFSPDPRPLSAPVGDSTPRDYQTHDFEEVKRLLEEEKERNKVLQESSQLEQMRKELEALRLRNAALEKRAVQDPQREATLKDLRSNPIVSSQVEQFISHFSTAGYAAILQRPTLSPQELRARIVHFSSLMYLATQFTWSSVRELHAAALFEIECGRANWGDSFTHLESRILQAPVKPSSRTGASRTEGSTAVFFCRDFQHGACKFNKDHYGTLRGERKWLQHICARCWVDTRVAARHTEFSKECPLAVEKDSPSSGMTAP